MFFHTSSDFDCFGYKIIRDQNLSLDPLYIKECATSCAVGKYTEIFLIICIHVLVILNNL